MRIIYWSSDVCSSYLVAYEGFDEAVDDVEVGVHGQALCCALSVARVDVGGADEALRPLPRRFHRLLLTGLLDRIGTILRRHHLLDLKLLFGRERAKLVGRLVKLQADTCGLDRKSVVKGKSVAVRVDLGGGRSIKKKKRQK